MSGWLTRLRRRSGRKQSPSAAGVPGNSEPSGDPPPSAELQSTEVLPSRLGRYNVQGVLAHGAMGRIFLAIDTATGTRVAVKTMMLDGLGGPAETETRERFFREARTVAGLQHPDIVAVYDSGLQGSTAYLAMELLPGTDLRMHCRGALRLPVDQALKIVARVADALAYAHTRGVVHRDVKPANLMVDLSTNTIKVTDFGLARTAQGSLTRTGLMLGSPSYMAPEQLLGEPLDGRADLYSLGVVLFEMLTGQLPHGEESISQLMRAIVTEAAPPLARYRPDLPSCVGDLLARALQKDRSLRFPDGEQLAKALREAAAQCSASEAHAGAAPGAIAARH